MGYTKILLADMLNELGEDKVKSILSTFSCPLNNDVELFLLKKAIPFVRQNISVTHLIFAPHRGNQTLVGYFTLAQKTINVSKATLSKTFRKRVSKFGTYNKEVNGYIVPIPLIAQLGKNFNNGYDKLITGEELLDIACKTVSEVQQVIGGKTVYLECEDKLKLVSFYNDHGFVNFGNRALDRDEEGTFFGSYLVQMLKYL